MKEVRKLKIESLILEIISTMIVMQEIKDPRVSTFLSVKEVRVSNDLTSAKVFITSFQKETTLDKAVAALNHAAGYIQGVLGKKMASRTTPKLQFLADHSIQESIELNSKIDEITKKV